MLSQVRDVTDFFSSAKRWFLESTGIKAVPLREFNFKFRREGSSDICNGDPRGRIVL